jgi:hypothetical protein
VTVRSIQRVGLVGLLVALFVLPLGFARAVPTDTLNAPLRLPLTLIVADQAHALRLPLAVKSSP